MDHDARIFADLLLSGFPDYRPYLRFIPAPEERTGDEGEEVEWDCGLIARIPSENSSMPEPLEVRVLNREVRPEWGDFWHTHCYATMNYPDASHLQESVSVIERVVTEQIVFWLSFRGEKSATGGSIRQEELPLTPIPDQVSAVGWADRIVLRSWRGTYDLVEDVNQAETPEIGGESDA